MRVERNDEEEVGKALRGRLGLGLRARLSSEYRDEIAL